MHELGNGVPAGVAGRGLALGLKLVTQSLGLGARETDSELWRGVCGGDTTSSGVTSTGCQASRTCTRTGTCNSQFTRPALAFSFCACVWLRKVP